jgi:hypothetical protein
MNKQTEMNVEQASSILRMMLYEHECNSACIDFDSNDDEEIERSIEWKKRKQALELAIKTLKGKKEN